MERYGAQSPAFRLLVGIPLTVVSLFVAYLAARSALADYFAYHRPDRLEQAVRLVPLNAEYWSLWADVVESDTRRRILALRTAQLLDPWNAGRWIAMGLALEQNHDQKGAEHCFMEAARVDRTYYPRWTIANFYFRQNRMDQFWRWAKRALEVRTRKVDALFDLCWAATQDADLILANALPEHRNALSSYLEFLLHTDRLPAAEPVAEKLMDRMTSNDAPVLLAACDRFIAAKRAPAAVPIWNALCRRKLIASTSIDPAHDLLLVNGDFAHRPLSRGFDWRVHQAPGITANPTSAGLEFIFSGVQPEACELLSQFLALSPGVEYRLEIRMQTDSLDRGTTLEWKLLDMGTGKELVAVSSENSQSRFRISTGSQRLVLFCRRPRAQASGAGSLSIRHVAIRRER